MSHRAGVVGVQGDVAEHVQAFRRLGERADIDLEVSTVRSPGIVPDCDVIALPGGESTAISRLVHEQGLADELRGHVRAGKPLMATCAGLIIAADDPGDDRVTPLGLLDVTVRRNVFGRQRESFQAAVDVRGLDEPFPGVFIRAPVVDDPGPADVVARVDGHAVAVRQGSVIGTAFHPELTPDIRLHRELCAPLL